MMEVSLRAPDKILVMGHSFIRRFTYFLSHSQDHSANLNLDVRSCFIKYSGIPGGTVAKFNDRQLAEVRRESPDLVVLQIGSNDLCDYDISVSKVVHNILSLVDNLHNSYHVQQVIIMQILHRHIPRNRRKIRPGFNMDVFNERVDAANQCLKSEVVNRQYATYWKHKGLCVKELLEAALCDDGVHLNNHIGYKKFFKNIRAAIVTTLKRL